MLVLTGFVKSDRFFIAELSLFVVTRVSFRLVKKLTDFCLKNLSPDE